MKKYQFKLEKVLALKKIHEAQARKELGEVVKSLSEKEDALGEATVIKSAFDRRFHELGRSGCIDPVFFRRYQSYQMTLGGDVVRRREEVNEQESVVDEARQVLQSKRRKTQVFEKLEEVSRETYLSEYHREEQKVMTEVALGRFRRRAESGQASLVLMAIGASGFVMGLLTLGILFALGSLNMNRVELIAQILRYREDHYQDSTMVVGHEDPYVFQKEKFERLREDAMSWREFQENDVDATVVITKEVLDHRRGLLHRIEETIARTRDEAQSALKEISGKDQRVQDSLMQLEKDKQEFFNQKKEKANVQKDKAQEELLQAFKSMDPEEVVKALTAGRELVDFDNDEARKRAVTKMADYMSKMGARQRAGLLQALSPEWSSTVVRHLEENTPL
jgi:flagellar export protein FliJ